MILVIFVDWHYREKPRPQKSGRDIFETAFIYIFHMNRPSVHAPNQCILSPKH